MSKFGKFVFTELKETEEILSLKRRFISLPMSKRNTVISGRSVRNPMGGPVLQELIRDLIKADVPILNLAKWASQANVDEMSSKKAEIVPYSIEIKKVGVTETHHISHSVDDEITEDGINDAEPVDDTVCVMGLVADPKAPCNPANLIADRVVHHINYKKKKVDTWKQGPYIGQTFLGAVSRILEEDVDASPADIAEIKNSPLATRNTLVRYWVESVPACIKVSTYTVPKSKELFPVPQVFSPSTKEIDYEGFMKQIPKALGNLGGEDCGMGYYAQTHMDGDATVLGSARKLMEFVTDFHPLKDVDVYYTSDSDVRKAWGMYFRCISEFKKSKVLVIYESSVINTTEIKKYIKGTDIVKGGVLGLPYNYFMSKKFPRVGYYSNTSVSIRVKEKDVAEGVASFETMVASYKMFSHVQLSVSLPVALKMLKDGSSNHFRVSATMRKCKVIYDSASEAEFKDMLWIYCWGLQHAYYWRWLSGPLVTVMPDIVKFSPRYQFHKTGKVEVSMPVALFEALNDEDIERMKMSLPSINFVVAEKEDEEEKEEKLNHKGREDPPPAVDMTVIQF